jgi:hypothetical protein
MLVSYQLVLVWMVKNLLLRKQKKKLNMFLKIILMPNGTTVNISEQVTELFPNGLQRNEGGSKLEVVRYAGPTANLKD